MTVVPVPEAPSTGTTSDLVHVVCSCKPETALCGEHVPGPFITDVEAGDVCVVCNDLEPLPCPRCEGP